MERDHLFDKQNLAGPADNADAAIPPPGVAIAPEQRPLPHLHWRIGIAADLPLELGVLFRGRPR
jgi:hypothetical protein